MVEASTSIMTSPFSRSNNWIKNGDDQVIRLLFDQKVDTTPHSGTQKKRSIMTQNENIPDQVGGIQEVTHSDLFLAAKALFQLKLKRNERLFLVLTGRYYSELNYEKVNIR